MELRGLMNLIGSILCKNHIKTSVLKHLQTITQGNSTSVWNENCKWLLIWLYLSIWFYIMKIIASLLDILSKLGGWSLGTFAVITYEEFASWLQPFVERSKQCRFVLKVDFRSKNMRITKWIKKKPKWFMILQIATFILILMPMLNF